MQVEVTTSGAVNTDSTYRVLDMLAIQGLGVQVSLDGLEKRHNAIRGVPWAFASVEHFVREAVRRGARVACAMALIDQSSGEAEATCALARSWGVS